MGRELAQEVLDADAGLTLPSLGRDLAGPGVDRDDNALPVALHQLVDEVGVGQRGRAEHDPLGAGSERRGHRPGVPEAAPELDLGVELGRDASHVREVHGAPGACAVEVDDVQRASSLLDPSPRRIERIGVIRRLLVVVAPQEPHRVPPSDVDRRQENHAGRATQSSVKLASNRNPAALDFSGWN